MATRGCAGDIWIGSTLTATGATASVAEVTEWSFESTAENLDASYMGACTKTFVGGPVQTSGQLTCNWAQETFASKDAEQALLEAAGTNVKIVLYPAGKTAGKTKYTTTSALITSVRVGAAVNGFVQSTFGFFVNGSLTAAAVT